MLITDPIAIAWITANMPWMEIHLPVVGDISWAQIVIAAGILMAMRAAKAEARVVDLAGMSKGTSRAESGD